jgi:mono/diheme cytochrome c family protein
MRAKQTSAAALLWASLLTGCDWQLPGKPDPANRPVPENQVVSFEPLFQAHCAGCHGAGGRLGPAPPLADPLFLAIVPDAELLRTITAGRKGTPMPAFAHAEGGSLNESQVKTLAAGLKEHWKGVRGLADNIPGKIPEYALKSAKSENDAASRERGLQLYAKACAGCHGKPQAVAQQAKGSGVGPIADPAFLALISNQALRRIMITGRPDLGMPNFAGKEGRAEDFQPLTSDDIDDLVALLASWRRAESLAGE